MKDKKKILDASPTEARNAVFTWCCRAFIVGPNDRIHLPNRCSMQFYG